MKSNNTIKQPVQNSNYRKVYHETKDIDSGFDLIAPVSFEGRIII